MSPQPDNSSALSSPMSQAGPGEFSPAERSLLLRIAHESIAAALENSKPPLLPPSGHLAEPRGVFTTLYSKGELRGCVGYVFPVMPLCQAVGETARAAAFDDNRFYPVTSQEVPELKISLSVLSPLQLIRPEEVEVGRHGLMVSLAGYKGLLLPQVPMEHHWDRITFLEQTCRKAGLPSDAWQRGATLEAFSAEVFGDKGAEP